MRRKRIYYTSGLISLISIPIIFLHYIPVPKEQVVLKFFLAYDDTTVNSRILRFSKGYIMKDIKEKKIIPIDLDEDHEMNFRKFNFIQSVAQRLKFTYDILHGLRIRLSSETNFGELVSFLKIILIDYHKR